MMYLIIMLCSVPSMYIFVSKKKIIISEFIKPSITIDIIIFIILFTRGSLIGINSTLLQFTGYSQAAMIRFYQDNVIVWETLSWLKFGLWNELGFANSNSSDRGGGGGGVLHFRLKRSAEWSAPNGCACAKVQLALITVIVLRIWMIFY